MFTKRSFRSLSLFAILVAFQCGVGACVKIHENAIAHHSDAFFPARDYVQLTAGKELEVVIPHLRSQRFELPSVARGKNGDLEVGDEFLGFEKVRYRVLERRDGGVRIKFVRGITFTQFGEQKGKIHKPTYDVFARASQQRYVRLVYLVRESKADHNMAVVSADDLQLLERATLGVTHSAACSEDAGAHCSWVPVGIAVNIE